MSSNRDSTTSAARVPAPFEGTDRVRFVQAPDRVREETAVIYCQGNFGEIDGKTANGLVRHSEKYQIVAVIDHRLVGQDAGKVLFGEEAGIPIYASLEDAHTHLETKPSCFIIGMAPATGRLEDSDRSQILEAISTGMTIVNGLHEFFSDDPEFRHASRISGSLLQDIRKPKPKSELKTFKGLVSSLDCLRIAVLGTDCATGKRTTATVLTQVLNRAGIHTVMIGTGQTGLMQGARYGVVLDSIPSQFCAGELENEILEAYNREKPEVIVVEGQGALGHPAYSSSAFVLRGSCPHGVILQHAPGRKNRCDFPNMKVPEPESEIRLIETFSETKVMGLAINPEGLSTKQLTRKIAQYREQLSFPVTDPLNDSEGAMLRMILDSYPQLTPSE